MVVASPSSPLGESKRLRFLWPLMTQFGRLAGATFDFVLMLLQLGRAPEHLHAARVAVTSRVSAAAGQQDTFAVLTYAKAFSAQS